MRYWTHSHNAVYGCTKVSPGCSRCWALGMAQRMASNPAARHLVEGVLTPNGGWSGKVNCHEDRLSMRDLERAQHRPVVAVDWMCDLFHEHVPEHFIAARLLEADRVARVRWLKERPPATFLFLTKRYDRLVTIVRLLNAQGRDLEGCLFGASCCTAEELRRATSAYLHLPVGATAWLSLEPLLTDPCLPSSTDPCLPSSVGSENPWQWVVLGGQSNGAKLREEHALAVRDWCIDTETQLLLKQWGGGPGVHGEHSSEPGKPPTLQGETFLDLPHGAMLVYVPGKGWRWR